MIYTIFILFRRNCYEQKKLTILGLFWCLLVMCFVVVGCDTLFQIGKLEDATQQNPIALTINKWTNEEIVKSDTDKTSDLWFSFYATTSKHYVYVKFSTLTNLNAYLYDKDLNQIGAYVHMSGNSGDVKSFSKLVNKGEYYYIKVTQGDYAYGTSDIGNFWISFNFTGEKPM